MNNFNDPNILNVYRFGSHVYGSNNTESDEDYILVLNEYTESDNIDHHHYTIKEFQTALDRHDIQALECFFLEDKDILKDEIEFEFNLDRSMLRTAISTVSDGSWVKGKKKLIVMADYDKKLAIKSIFHSLRIRDFGIQIATEGKIFDYSRMNYILDDLYKLGEEFDKSELWEKIKDKYRKVYNSMKSTFVSLCPKPSNHHDKVQRLKKIFKDYNIVTEDKMLDKIIETLGNK